MPVLRIGCLVACLLLGAACGEQGGTSPDARDGSEPSATATLPTGWRWESYAGVQIGVPGDWAWANSGMRIGQWCVESSRDPELDAAVGRPGAATLMGCPQGDPDPSTLLVNTGVIAAFELVQDGVEPDISEAGDQSVLRLGDVVIRVNAPAALREQILSTAHETEVDAKGCQMHLPADFESGRPPSPSADVTTLTEVTALAACRYALPHSGARSPLPLLSSLRLEGDQAVDVAAAIARAPAGGGPDRPDSCLPEYSYGDEFIVVQIESAAGMSRVHAYYSGCDHNGFDDGVTIRSLTREAIRPLVADGNEPTSFSGPAEKVEMLNP